jgi:hypothetical protein
VAAHRLPIGRINRVGPRLLGPPPRTARHLNYDDATRTLWLIRVRLLIPVWRMRAQTEAARTCKCRGCRRRGSVYPDSDASTDCTTLEFPRRSYLLPFFPFLFILIFYFFLQGGSALWLYYAHSRSRKEPFECQALAILCRRLLSYFFLMLGSMRARIGAFR